MELRFQCLGPDHWKTEVLLAPAFQGDTLHETSPLLDRAAPWLAIAPAARDFRGKKGELILMHGHPQQNVPRVLAVGLGKPEDFSPAVLREALAAAVRHCRALEPDSLLLPAPLLERLPGGLSRLVEESAYAALLALYAFRDLKKDDPDTPRDPQWLTFAFDGDHVPDAAREAARRGERAAQAVMLTRDLANTPPNMLAPADLAERAERIAQSVGLRCTVLDEEALRGENMGALLAVGQGSSRPPRLVVLEHAPDGHEQDKPLILVGKGITFDSGGICIKPGAKMHTMKCDMTGAAAVLSALVALAEEGTPRRVIGLMACAENLPDGSAFRPGDVVRAASGDTVEIQNTDAEGRLVLCDALSYAQKMWTPAAVVDIATLTGACAVALGGEVAGLFCDDDDLAERLTASAALGGEHLWRLPLWTGYEKNLKSQVADICHTGPREGGAIHAALFLKHFIRDGVRWAHLDIAGVDWADSEQPLCPAGATGFGTRTLLELIRGGI